MRSFTKPLHWLVGAGAISALGVWGSLGHTPLEASSHREAPLIADDPLADNTDVYAFVAPNDPNRVVLIANYIPFQLPQGGPNYYTFGENIRYEIHVKNDGTTPRRRHHLPLHLHAHQPGPQHVLQHSPGRSKT